jgi:hypothetical protein
MCELQLVGKSGIDHIVENGSKTVIQTNRIVIGIIGSYRLLLQQHFIQAGILLGQIDLIADQRIISVKINGKAFVNAGI